MVPPCDMSLVTNGLHFSQCLLPCHTIFDSVMHPVRVETAAGQVHTAVMHTVEMDASTEDLRMTAMYLRSPIHTLMFSSKGALLGANFSALEACRVHTPGGKAMTVFQTHLELQAKHVLYGCLGRVVAYFITCGQAHRHVDIECMPAHALNVSLMSFAYLQ